MRNLSSNLARSFLPAMKQFNMPTGTGDSEVEGSNPVAYAPVAMIHILGLGYEQNTSTDSGVDGAGENIVGVTTPATIVSALSLTLYNNGIKNSLSGPDVVPSISVARPRSGLYRVQIRTPSGLFISGPTKPVAGAGFAPCSPKRTFRVPFCTSHANSVWSHSATWP